MGSMNGTFQEEEYENHTMRKRPRFVSFAGLNNFPGLALLGVFASGYIPPLPEQLPVV